MKWVVLILIIAASVFSQNPVYVTRVASHNGVRVRIGYDTTSNGYIGVYYCQTSTDSVHWNDIGFSGSSKYVYYDIKWLGDRFMLAGGFDVNNGTVWYSNTGAAYSFNGPAAFNWLSCRGQVFSLAFREVRMVPGNPNKFIVRGYVDWFGSICYPNGITYYYFYSTDSCKTWYNYDGADWNSAVTAIEVAAYKTNNKKVIPIYYDISGRKVKNMIRAGIYFKVDGVRVEKIVRVK